MKNLISLKARALRYLSQREHSRLELSRKLSRYSDNETDIEQILNELETKDLLSNNRFTESLLKRRASRLGTSRIIAELKQHAPSHEQLQTARAQLSQTELVRAQQVWQKRFNAPAQDAKERAKQIRFLLGRGFPQDMVIRLVDNPLKHQDESSA